MSEAKITYLGESGTHYILKIEDEEGFIGLAEVRKCRKEWADKYYWEEEYKKAGVKPLEAV